VSAHPAARRIVGVRAKEPPCDSDSFQEADAKNVQGTPGERL
jgi:hypothetical protein